MNKIRILFQKLFNTRKFIEQRIKEFKFLNDYEVIISNMKNRHDPHSVSISFMKTNDGQKWILIHGKLKIDIGNFFEIFEQNEVFIEERERHHRESKINDILE